MKVEEQLFTKSMNFIFAGPDLVSFSFFYLKFFLHKTQQQRSAIMLNNTYFVMRILVLFCLLFQLSNSLFPLFLFICFFIFHFSLLDGCFD